MAKYIEREAAMDAILGENPDAHYPAWYAVTLMGLPVADVAPVVHGHWIPISDGAGAECSECGEYYDVSDNGGMAAFELFCDCYKHRPHCGAKMDGGTY